MKTDKIYLYLYLEVVNGLGVEWRVIKTGCLLLGNKKKWARDIITRFWSQTSFRKYTNLRGLLLSKFCRIFLQNSRSSLLLVGSVVKNTLLSDWWVTHGNTNSHQCNQHRLRQGPSSFTVWGFISVLVMKPWVNSLESQDFKGMDQSHYSRSTREGYP